MKESAEQARSAMSPGHQEALQTNIQKAMEMNNQKGYYQESKLPLSTCITTFWRTVVVPLCLSAISEKKL